MNKRILFAALAATLSFPLAAHAEWNAGVGLENFGWKENIPGAAITPTESGLRNGYFVNWTQDGDNGMLFGWRAKYYTGRVNYDTSDINGVAVKTYTRYSGISSEGQLLYRTDAGALKLDYLAGIGSDIWKRTIENVGFNQIEDYSILYLRAGINLDSSKRSAGMHGGLGLKYPFATSQNAHLTDLGYTSNPALHPGKAVSGYAELGYRINNRYDVVGYYDSWRFKKSNVITTQDKNGNLVGIWQPESSMDVLGVKFIVSMWWL